MAVSLNPGLLRDLIEAKGAVARHGIVLMRSIENDLAPAMVAEARDSIASSPRKLSQMTESELDKYIQKIRKKAMKAAEELADMYKRLLTRLGTEDLVELQKDLEGIGQLYTWDRVSRSVDEVNTVLSEKGFAKVDLDDPTVLSEEFSIELNERWPAAFARFSKLAKEASEELQRQERTAEPQLKAKSKRAVRRG